MKHILRIEGIDLRRSSTFRLHLGRIRLNGGTILCVAGPNGSGKSTLIECIAGVLTAPGVKIVVDGQPTGRNMRPVKATIGYIPDDENWFVKELCAKEYFGVLINTYGEFGVPKERMEYRVRQLAHTLRFTAFEQSIESLSHGNKKKVQLIAGLLHEPGVIVIDELRNGLDPMAIVAAERIIHDEAARGACVIAATHDLWWAERIAHETMLLLDGAIVIHSDTGELLKKYGSLERLFMQVTQGAYDHSNI